MSNTVIYHLDANFLLSYLIPDNKDLHGVVRKKIERKNWYNDVYKMSKYALGEVFNRVLNYSYSNSITWDSVNKNMVMIKDLINQNKLVTFDLDHAGKDWRLHFDELMKIKDSLVQTADRFVLALFCGDQEAKKFYTFDSHIVESKDINSYIEGLSKRIEEIQ
ncbi:hypothetical protein [Caldiplasma sukawensis]